MPPDNEDRARKTRNQRNSRARKEAEGLVPVQGWVPARFKERALAYLRRLRRLGARDKA